MKKRSRKAPKRKKHGHAQHKKKSASHHHEAKESHFDTAPNMETRIMSEEEKRELIRAHAENRHGRKKLGLGYYTAICLSCVVVGSGWILTLEENFGLKAPVGDDPAIESIQDSVESFKRNAAIRIPEAKKDFEQAQTQIKAYQEEQTLTNSTSTDEHQE